MGGSDRAGGDHRVAKPGIADHECEPRIGECQEPHAIRAGRLEEFLGCRGRVCVVEHRRNGTILLDRRGGAVGTHDDRDRLHVHEPAADRSSFVGIVHEDEHSRILTHDFTRGWCQRTLPTPRPEMRQGVVTTVSHRTVTDPCVSAACELATPARVSSSSPLEAPSTAPASSPELVALGERLFVEPMLSGDRMRSCASCYRPEQAFADGVTIAPSIDPRGSRVARNTPTLINAALQPAQFADERSVTLEDQALEVLRSAAEMHSSAERAAASLAADSAYRISFARAFGGAASVAVTPLRVRQALAAYVRTLVSLNSRFDRAVRGDTSALTAGERHGFTLFMGKAMCGTCHFTPLFSGNTPPLYMGSDVEVIGTPVTPSAPGTLDPDSGRARIDDLPNHLRAFKTPSLRNVALTAPYMHNGAFRTLDDVLLFYDHGGARGAGARIDDQTLSADSLHLSAEERDAIIAFLGSLTDTSGLGATPLALRSRAMPPSAGGSTRPR